MTSHISKKEQDYRDIFEEKTIESLESEQESRLHETDMFLHLDNYEIYQDTDLGTIDEDE